MNHWGTAELSYALEESSVKKVIYASSASVYGVSETPKTVQDKPSPNTSYAISKPAWRIDVASASRPNASGHRPVCKYLWILSKFAF